MASSHNTPPAPAPAAVDLLSPRSLHRPVQLQLVVDTWTSTNGRGTFTAVLARLDDGQVETNFCLPSNKEELVVSRARWEGWIDLLAHPTGGGLLPPATTERQRAVLRALARILIDFSAGREAGMRLNGAQFLRRMLEVAGIRGLAGETQLEIILDSVAEAREHNVAPSDDRDNAPAVVHELEPESNGDSDSDDSESSLPSLRTASEHADSD
ncbi:hypothetical protein VTO73DRAFT_2508 [Trametes versicolor]